MPSIVGTLFFVSPHSTLTHTPILLQKKTKPHRTTCQSFKFFFYSPPPPRCRGKKEPDKISYCIFYRFLHFVALHHTTNNFRGDNNIITVDGVVGSANRTTAFARLGSNDWLGLRLHSCLSSSSRFSSQVCFVCLVVWLFDE